MSLNIRDGNSNPEKLFTTTTGSDGEHLPHHIIQEISGSSIASVINILNNISASVKTGGSVQTITASYANPIPITGSINVDVQVSDLITVTSSLANPVVVGLYGSNNIRAFIDSNGAQLVTSSNSAPVYVSASLANPIGITGSTTINNLTQTSHNSSTYSGLLTPIGIVGSSGNRVTVDSNNALLTTGSVTVNNLKDTDYNSTSYTAGKLTPIGLVGSSGYRANVDSNGAVQITGSALITGSVTVNNLKDTDYNSTSYSGKVTPSGLVGYSGYRLQIDSSGSLITTSSYANPVVVTASFSQPLAVKITSSNSEYVNVRHTVPTGAIRNVFSTSDSTINFGDLTNFGAFAICSNNINRKGLTITNPTPQRLFIAIATQASSSGAGRNGFSLTNNTSDPNSYSFVIYPSGSYFADSTNVTLFYGGYFVSSSNALKAMVTETY
jgi:hypothetical protein